MTDYTFSTLNDKEFEILSTDILSEHLNIEIERFKGGRDGGVDGRYFVTKNKEVIIQCKHYLGSGYSQLISKIKSEEVSKVKKLNPFQYVFVTSLPLSRINKTEIKNLFSPFIKNESDIYGQEDLNDLLKKFPKIEEHHYKLWLSSITIFNRLINNAIEGRSQSLLKEINKKINFYVQTSNHTKAFDILNKTNALIITGEPGIGKTTLAENLCYYYASQEYDLYVIENSLNEAENVFQDGKKQVFYFDDFLGSNFLQALISHEDSHITRFIQRIKNDKKKKFILTSRTNIFNSALTLSDNFLTKKIDKNEFLLTVDNLSSLDKAKILYNHLWFNSIQENYIDEIYFDKRYLDIINHIGFNPRIIEFLTDNDRIESIKSNHFWDYIQETLNNPSDIWSNTFYNQSDEFIRSIVLLIVFNDNEISEQLLKSSYLRIIKGRELQSSTNISTKFKNVIQTTVRYFVNRNQIDKSRVQYTLFNPSLADFIMQNYKDEVDIVTATFIALQSLQSLKVLDNLYKEKYFSIYDFEKLLKALYNNLDINNNTNINNNYIIQVLHLVMSNDMYKKLDIKVAKIFIQKVFEEERQYSKTDCFIDVLIYLMENKYISKINEPKLEMIVDNANDDVDDINSLVELINYLNINNEYITENLNEKATAFIEYRLEESVHDIDIEGYVSYNYDDYDVDTNGIEAELITVASDLTYEIIENEFIEIDTDTLAYDVDIDNLVDSHFSNQWDGNDGERHSSGSQNNISDINDLFDR